MYMTYVQCLYCKEYAWNFCNRIINVTDLEKNLGKVERNNN